MPIVTGSVEDLHAAEDGAWVVVVDEATARPIKLLLWSDISEDYTPRQRLVHGVWISLLRDALVHRLRVEVAYPAAHTFVTAVQVSA